MIQTADTVNPLAMPTLGSGYGTPNSRTAASSVAADLKPPATSGSLPRGVHGKTCQPRRTQSRAVSSMSASERRADRSRVRFSAAGPDLCGSGADTGASRTMDLVKLATTVRSLVLQSEGTRDSASDLTPTKRTESSCGNWSCRECWKYAPQPGIDCNRTCGRETTHPSSLLLLHWVDLEDWFLGRSHGNLY